MNQKLLEFLSSFPDLSKEEVEAIAAHIPIVEFKKGTVFLKEGEVPGKCYFVLEGCVRQYSIVDGEEKTTAFYTEKFGTISSTDYTNRTPSGHYLVCAEDSLLLWGDPSQSMENFAKFPVLKSIVSDMLVEELNQAKDKFSNFIIANPEQRYLNFLEERPDLVNRVPQHQIASLLGMTPESLSRIRRRIQKKMTKSI
jgi:CRP-like cAMP-binding protein